MQVPEQERPVPANPPANPVLAHAGKFGWSLLLALLVGCIAAAALSLAEFAPRLPGLSDKTEHAVAFMAAAYTTALVFQGPGRWWQLALALIAIGALLEVGQHFVPGRTPDIGDGIANAIGVVLGITAFQILKIARPAGDPAEAPARSSPKR